MTNSLYSTRDDDIYHNFGVLGIDFLKYYDFLFDYRKLRKGEATGMYYEPNMPFEERDYGFFSFIKNIPEFGILDFDLSESELFIRSLIKDSIAYKEFGLRPGMEIVKLNKKSIAEISQEELFGPFFYLAVENYTALENGVERTIPSPLKSSLHEAPPTNRSK
jgi:hypothetical protein